MRVRRNPYGGQGNLNKEVNMAKIFKYESFGETLEFAESLGWEDTEEEWSPAIAGELEESAIDFIKAQGYKIRGYDE